jgi:hypothetical protein
MVAALVILFAMTAGAVIWLARDVDRSVSNRSIAGSIAFQAARAGAQQVDVGTLRDSGSDVAPVLDVSDAERHADDAARRLFESYEVEGTTSCAVPEPDLVVCDVTLRCTRGAPDVTGRGAARAEVGP